MNKLILKILTIIIVTTPLNASEKEPISLKVKEITICTPKICHGKTTPINENKLWHMFKNVNSNFFILINNL